MATATLHAEVVARDGAVASRFREWLQGMDYEVTVRDDADSSGGEGADLVIYHVPEQALAAERRATVRPGSIQRKRPRYWMESLWLMRNRAPGTPIIAAIAPVQGAADKAIASGATDVIEENVTLPLFRRRMEMVQAYRRVWIIPANALLPPAAEVAATRPERRDGGLLELPLPELRNEQSGRIDAQRVADYLAIPLRRLAEAMSIGYAGLHKTPDSTRVQGPLSPIVRVLELANRAFGDAEPVRKWLNRPLHELEDESPLAVILAGEADAVETLLVNALGGIPA